MLTKALCAFREPYKGGFVEGAYPGEEIDVPEELAARLVADGHISRPIDAGVSDVREQVVARRVNRRRAGGGEP